jgi:hypothetical protein
MKVRSYQHWRHLRCAPYRGQVCSGYHSYSSNIYLIDLCMPVFHILSFFWWVCDSKALMPTFCWNIWRSIMICDYGTEKSHSMVQGRMLSGLSVVYPPADGTRYLCWMLWFLGPNQPIGLTGTRENMGQKKLITQQWTLSSMSDYMTLRKFFQSILLHTDPSIIFNLTSTTEYPYQLH